jgi:SAM-dependent methyltransferase
MSTPRGRTAHEKDAEPNAAYVAFHRPRFDFLLRLLERHRPHDRPRVLDVGRSLFTTMAADRLRVPIDSLGLEPPADLATGRHHAFDLNDAIARDRWPAEVGPYDVVVFAEVIEHLHVPPEAALDFLRSVLVPGGLLIVQTPNAASLGKRVKLALGVNPFERLRADPSNPGHYREYTLRELADMLLRTGFRVEDMHRRYYFDARYARHETGSEPPRLFSGALRNVANRLLPPWLREGITIVARRPA